MMKKTKSMKLLILESLKKATINYYHLHVTEHENENTKGLFLEQEIAKGTKIQEQFR